MATRNKTTSPAVRKEVSELMKLYYDGEHTVALRRAVKLALRHSDSALVFKLVGVLHWAAFLACASGVSRDEAKTGGHRHMLTALSAYSTSAWLAPDCIDAALSHAEMLAQSEQYFEAQAEFDRALRISDPVDPAENSLGFDLYCDKSFTKAERIRNARGSARDAMELFRAMICDEFVPKESVQVLNDIKLGGNSPADARERAKRLATTFPYSGRAQLLRAYVDLERVRGFDPSIDKRRFLRRTLDMVQEPAITFPSSLVIALFHAKLLFILDEYDDAECECRRALAVDTPDDPNIHDLPPGSVSGAEYDDRVSFVKNLLRRLIGKIIIVTALYSRTLTSEAEDSLVSVRVQPLLEIYNSTDKSSAKTITDALRFFKGCNSWSFWICPLSGRCDGRKFVDTSSLWRHLCSKHPDPDELWSKLQSVLDPTLYENAPESDRSLKWITLSQDSEQRDFFRLIELKDMFESLFFRLTLGKTEPESLVEMRAKKCRGGAEILDGIKERLRTLPADMCSSQFYEARSAIQKLWLKFLKNTVLDYRETIFPLVSSFGKIKKCMGGDPNIVGHIGAYKIDAIFDDVPSVPGGKNVSVVEHGSNPSDANKMGTSKQNLKPSSSNGTHKTDEEPHECELCVEDGNSEGMTNQKLSGPPMDVEVKEMELSAILANMELELEVFGSINIIELLCFQENFNIPYAKGTSSQLAEKMGSTTSYKIVNVLNENNADKDLFILHVIIQSFWNLRCFRDEILRAPPVWIVHINENRCIADLFYEIFSAWEKNEHDSVTCLLTSVKASLCKIANRNMFQKLQAGIFFASEVVEMILHGLHMSEASLPFDFNSEIEGQVWEFFYEKEHTKALYRLDDSSPQTTKIKSFVELPVLYDEQPFSEGNCEHCGSPKIVDVSPSNTPHLFTIGLDWVGRCENQVQLSEVLVGITQPLDIKFLHKGLHSSSNYALASMICYAGGRYVCFARDEDKWLICSAETVEAEDTWEQLLERFRDCRLQPQVLFFEGIKQFILVAFTVFNARLSEDSFDAIA
ncbi:hypothetical protein GUJ93_ZPchr0002g25584 [Zizania palustris]|uniref:DUF629 domain-containing protein n=1 Tax=Zizania palustris TaxID=103762 RepID=A0A8J5S1R6_ZIZPA|nr:hypothetical protein GUJ93_ZPchr0002g25584 [Zizania palustris]